MAFDVTRGGAHVCVQLRRLALDPSARYLYANCNNGDDVADALQVWTIEPSGAIALLLQVITRMEQPPRDARRCSFSPRLHSFTAEEPRLRTLPRRRSTLRTRVEFDQRLPRLTEVRFPAHVETDILGSPLHEGRSLVWSMGRRHFHGSTKGRALNMRQAATSNLKAEVKVPGAERAIVDEAKVRDYVLATEHPIGRAKARFLAHLGFERESWGSPRSSVRSRARRG